jgi:radical SAM superfamily enzyme YgiQ (UPF0313 family)
MVMLHYDQPLFRPPSEAYSLIIQATLGCSHNACLFCGMYKSKSFQTRPLETVLKEIKEVASGPYGPSIRKVFLADGDCLVLDTPSLLKILQTLKISFPNLSRISSYASAPNILDKSSGELKEIRNAGLSLLYLGLESGDAKILEKMHKGSTPEENIRAVLKAKEADFTLSVMIILGLGGKERWKEHALMSAKAASEMNPRFLSALTLMVPPQAPLHRLVRKNEFTLLKPEEVLAEQKELIGNIEGKGIIFRSTHASNYLPLKGVLSRDKEEILRTIENSLKTKNLRPDFLRGL